MTAVTMGEALQFINVLLVPVLYYLHNIDKRITVIETVERVRGSYGKETQ